MLESLALDAQWIVDDVFGDRSPLGAMLRYIASRQLLPLRMEGSTNRITLRRFLLISAALAALFFGLQTMAHEPQAAQGADGAVSVAAPSWQKGAYWATVDHQLLIDFADLARFHDANLQTGPPTGGRERVIFMGDSITEGWHLDKSFRGKPYINRGISGQTSSQMLLRFRQDVIDLKPKVVLILAGTNDFAENTGPLTLDQVEGNIISMAQLSTANGIRAVLCSVLPSVRFPWHPEVQGPATRIATLNRWMKGYAAENKYVYVDYYSAMKDPAGGLPSGLSPDGVHPSVAGYAIMAPLAESGIKRALDGKG
ncbi:MAG: SGNH/GDSL hydrolase family protein [Candidatus Acidiferrales bacterium]